MKLIPRLLLLVLFSLLQVSAWAQQWPAKPVRLLIPYPPGGSNEILARPIAQKLTELWGRAVVLDFRPGAGGSIATEATARG